MKVFICSPFAAFSGLKTTVEGHFMLAPHLCFPQFLEGRNAEERESRHRA